jgi:prepilin-type N-terminal cleavage/methylation domain-containing protein
MDTQFKVKLINHLNKKNQNKGFTLIELLVVVIIIGVLAAIALPNLLNQVAKGRQAEAKNNLGAINRAQQAYRLERASFGTLSRLPITVTGQYYTFTGGVDNQVFASHSAVALTTYGNDVRDYGSGVNQTTAGVFTNIICETDTPNVTLAAVPAGATTCAASHTPVN